jgi:hypothetical protein
MEDEREPPKGGFGRPVGSADPRSAPFAPTFVWVTARWIPRSVPDVWIG